MEDVLGPLGVVGLTILVAAGLVAGWLAGLVAGRNRVGYILLGVVGAVALPFVFAALGIGILAMGGLALFLIAAVVMALILVVLGHFLFGGGK